MALLLAGLTSFSKYSFTLILDAFALIRLRWSNCTNLGSFITYQFLIGTRHRDIGVISYREGYP